MPARCGVKETGNMLTRGFWAALTGGLVAATVTVTPEAASAANGGPGGDATAAIVAWNTESLAVTLAEPLNPPLEDEHRDRVGGGV
jgi:hypothetical protein